MSNPSEACSWNRDCQNDACGREGDVDKKVCCSTGKTCSYWGFDWCSEYNSGDVCKHDCQCRSGTCDNGRCASCDFCWKGANCVKNPKSFPFTLEPEYWCECPKDKSVICGSECVAPNTNENCNYCGHQCSEGTSCTPSEGNEWACK
jgi:hypothetical protein